MSRCPKSAFFGQQKKVVNAVNIHDTRYTHTNIPGVHAVFPLVQKGLLMQGGCGTDCLALLANAPPEKTRGGVAAIIVDFVFVDNHGRFLSLNSLTQHGFYLVKHFIMMTYGLRRDQSALWPVTAIFFFALSLGNSGDERESILFCMV